MIFKYRKPVENIFSRWKEIIIRFRRNNGPGLTEGINEYQYDLEY